MTACMVIPTYWTTGEDDSWTVFDHPARIDEPGTLRRTLEKLQAVGLKMPLVLFPAPTDERIERRVEELAQGIDLDVRVFTAADLQRARETLQSAGAPEEFVSALHMNSYGAIRNMGLLYAALAGHENVIQIDDDELIEDPDYFAKALNPIGTTVAGQKVLGTTGYYLDEAGNAYYDGQMDVTFKNWPKDELFNREVKHNLDCAEAIHPTTCAFGGNMVINREMFLQVAYDPWGTRGEDDDYTFNALHKGLQYYFVKDFWVRHLPPKRRKAYWTRHRQDIIRFKYLREKARAYGLKPEQMGIFNGTFIRDDLEYRAVSSSVDAARQFVDRDREEFDAFLESAVLAVALPVSDLLRKVELSLGFQQQWAERLPGIEGAWA